jgi:hypothetical protein
MASCLLLDTTEWDKRQTKASIDNWFDLCEHFSHDNIYSEIHVVCIQKWINWRRHFVYFHCWLSCWTPIYSLTIIISSFFDRRSNFFRFYVHFAIDSISWQTFPSNLTMVHTHNGKPPRFLKIVHTRSVNSILIFADIWHVILLLSVQLDKLILVENRNWWYNIEYDQAIVKIADQ